MILLIDNYDSFSYNLFQYVGEIEPDIKVVRNDELSVEEIMKLAPDRIIISPGPGRPEDAGITQAAAGELGKKRVRRYRHSAFVSVIRRYARRSVRK